MSSGLEYFYTIRFRWLSESAVKTFRASPACEAFSIYSYSSLSLYVKLFQSLIRRNQTQIPQNQTQIRRNQTQMRRNQTRVRRNEIRNC